MPPTALDAGPSIHACDALTSPALVESGDLASVLAIDDRYVYWANQSNSILRAPKRGGVVETIGSTPTVRRIFSLVVDESFAYWLSGDSLEVWKARKDGSGFVERIYTGGDFGLTMTQTACELFIGATRGVFRIRKDGGGAQRVSNNPFCYGVSAMGRESISYTTASGPPDSFPPTLVERQRLS